MKFDKFIRIAIIMVLAFISIHCILRHSTKPSKDVPTVQGRTSAPATLEEGAGAILPSMFDIQRELVRHGYDLKVDGKIGPETLEAWNKALCDQYSSESMRKAGQ